MNRKILYGVFCVAFLILGTKGEEDFPCGTNIECRDVKACINGKCLDPCPNSCGENAKCVVKGHVPVCYCPAGMTGDPFTYCKLIAQPIQCGEESRCPDDKKCTKGICVDKCDGACGDNAKCIVRDGEVICSCPPEMEGNPLVACTPLTCLVNSDCPKTATCYNNKCQDSCQAVCGVNATCTLLIHTKNRYPECSCPAGTTGDPYIICNAIKD